MAAKTSASQLNPRTPRFADRYFLFRWSELNATIGRVPLKAMQRRDFVTLLGGAAAWPLAGRAQQATRPPRIGWLSTGSPISHRLSLAAFQDGLRALGYIEGGNVTIEYRWAEGNLDRLPELASQLVQQQVEIILAGGSTGAQAAKNATSIIPIIAAGTGDLVELGLVTSFARPGGNLTGFVTAAPETAGKRLQIMTEIAPQARRAAVLWTQGATNSALEWKVVTQLASALGLALEPYDARTLQDLDQVLAAIMRSAAQMLFVLNDPFIFTHRKTIIESAAKSRLAAIYGFREFVDDGGLISYGPNISDGYRRAAAYVDMVLKGAKSGDLPVQAPTKFELVINLKTARALGLEVPPTLLARADAVIE
jgi:putative ABC transport system substrate-binding protein